MCYFDSFHSFDILAKALAALRDLRQNFLDKQCEICHKRFSCEKISDLSQMYEITKMSHLGHILGKITVFVGILRVF